MPIDVSCMKGEALYEGGYIVTTHGNNDLLSRWTFSSHLDVGFRFILAIDDVIDLADFLGIEGRECFLDFQNFRGVD